MFNKLTMLWYFLFMYLNNTLKQLAWHGDFLQSKKTLSIDVFCPFERTKKIDFSNP